VDAGLIAADFPLALPSVSGYSGGGRTMIEAYEPAGAAFELYALGLKHKHMPEIMKYTGLTRRPCSFPSVGNFRQGMLVQLPLHLDLLPGQPKASRPARRAGRALRRQRMGQVEPPTDGKLDALALNDTNKMELRVFANPEATARPCWSPGWTTWARAPAARRCRT
jgi:N-acetyl-gamma-glutamyl-phosphate reductase